MTILFQLILLNYLIFIVVEYFRLTGLIKNSTNLNAAQRKLSVKTLNTFVGDRDVAIQLQFSNICCNTQTFVGQRDVAICNAQKFLSLDFRKWKVFLKPG